VLLLAVPACRQAQEASKDTPEEKPVRITLATTTSTRDTGLLDVLLPMFQKETGVEVKVVAVGSGQAMKLGQDGNADVLLTHSPAAEEKFMAAGYGAHRDAVMHNDFIVVGPADDPAEVKGQKSVAAAFAQIAKQEAPFVSRGDDSGTHRKEMDIWKKADLKPGGAWYLQCGQGMAEALRVASEKRANTLSDRGTFLAQRKKLELVVLVEGDPLLLNRYAVIQLNPEKYPHLNHDAARRFAEFLRRTDVQKLIGEFGVAEFGQPLFFPDAK
jgi:tungstate transport system substrate-binding protein